MDSQISWQVSLHCPHRKCVTGLFFLSSVSLGAFILFHLPSNHRCRTDWFDHDDPTLNGDYEVLSDLLSIYPRQICPQPIAIEVQTIYGEPASNTSDNFLNYDATYGFACVNAAQGRRSCGDYKVRFTCPKEFCQVTQQCRTRWMNSDTPSDEGDVESILQLRKSFPGQVCANPVSIEAKTTSGISANETLETFLSYDVSFGFACINEKQKNKQCEDYQVIFICPSDFCRGKFLCK
uniref:Si:dkey-205h13.2 n=1 Tax=Acanthochromis polyacanthus TaxID=80966 RepID=A0A3Q1FKU5_9TELE